MLKGVVTKNFYFGNLGINSYPININNDADPFPSALATLRDTNQIPNSSFGYTVGAFHQLKPVLSSHVFDD